MQAEYPYDNKIFFNAASRSLSIGTENVKNAESLISFLETADCIARREHDRPAQAKYHMTTSGNSVEITSETNNLGDLIAALNDMYSLSYITKAKKVELVLQIDKFEDTPERRAKIKAAFIANIKARRKQQQQEMSVGSGSQLLMAPKKDLALSSNSANGHHLNGNGHVTSLKPSLK